MSTGAKLLLLLLLFIFCWHEAKSKSKSLSERPKESRLVLVNVRSFGARADGQNDDAEAFTAAWREACQATGTVSIIVPRGTYLIGPVRFQGPCKHVSALTFQMSGYLKATKNLDKYESGGGWVEFKEVNGLTLTGGGTFDGQGATAWPYNKCPTESNCKLLPTNVKFLAMNKTVVRGITSVNSKFFHMALVGCRDFKGTRLRISAPARSPNTDGDDCISVGQGNSQVVITSINCGPGHGISVGSLGRYPSEGDVNGLVVKDCTMRGTTNGLRIKTWANSPGLSSATNMTFKDIVMNNVTNPIIINQSYCPYSTCSSTAPSRVRLSDIHFKDIRGTTSSPVAVALHCSRGVPCRNVFLENVHLDLISGKQTPTSSCRNVRATYMGTQVPPPCS